MNRYLLILSLLFAARIHAQTPVDWPVQDGVFDIANFRFHDGQTLPTLHLHYLTLGKLHRNSQGHADNAVLLLHGTGGSARSLLNPVFSNVLFGPGNPSTSASTFSSSLTVSVTVSPASHPTAFTCIFPLTTTTTWSPASTPCWWTVFTSIICV